MGSSWLSSKLAYLVGKNKRPLCDIPEDTCDIYRMKFVKGSHVQDKYGDVVTESSEDLYYELYNLIKRSGKRGHNHQRYTGYPESSNTDGCQNKINEFMKYVKGTRSACQNISNMNIQYKTVSDFDDNSILKTMNNLTGMVVGPKRQVKYIEDENLTESKLSTVSRNRFSNTKEEIFLVFYLNRVVFPSTLDNACKDFYIVEKGIEYLKQALKFHEKYDLKACFKVLRRSALYGTPFAFYWLGMIIHYDRDNQEKELDIYNQESFKCFAIGCFLALKDYMVSKKIISRERKFNNTIVHNPVVGMLINGKNMSGQYGCREESSNFRKRSVCDPFMFRYTDTSKPYYKHHEMGNYSDASAYYFIGNRSNELGVILTELGNCYRFGVGIDRDCKKAIHYYELSVMCGCLDSVKELADFYYSGKGGVKRDKKKAAHYYRLAENTGESLVGCSWIYKKKWNCV